MKISRNLKKFTFYKKSIRNKSVFKNFKQLFTACVYNEIVKPDSFSKRSNEYSNIYVPDEPLIFADNKYRVVKAEQAEKSMGNVLWGVLFPLGCFSGYKAIKSLVLLRPVRTIFWSILFCIVYKPFRDSTANQEHFITSIYLLEDGKRLEIQVFKGKKKIVDISTVRRLTPNEVEYMHNIIPSANQAFIPIVIDNHFYLIYKNAYIQDKGVFAAISNGKYIQVENQNKIEKEEAIDIDSK